MAAGIFPGRGKEKAMADLVYVMPWKGEDDNGVLPLLDREWLVANGLGGYASGTVAGAATRRYHGLLIAAHPAPLGRVMMFNHLSEQLRLPDWSTVRVGGKEHVGGALDLHGTDYLTQFRLEAGLPVWRYELPGHVVEKRLFLPYLQNTVCVSYHLVSGAGPLRLKLRPAVHFRGHDAPVDAIGGQHYTLTASDGHYELNGGREFPSLRLHVSGEGAALTLDGEHQPNILYRIEESRGYEASGSLWSPGQFRFTLCAGQDVALVASTESWDRVLAFSAQAGWEAEHERRRRLLQAAAPAVLQDDYSSELVLAADQFLIRQTTRQEDAARAQAAGDEARSVIAGYHWFTDWGRDTMISLEGLTLTTGRHREAGYLLRTFASYVRDGLIPNLFPEGQHEGLYHTADATLWYVHALDRYLEATGDRETLRHLLPTLHDIVDHHLAGTRFGIGVDSKDGLLRQGAEGYQLTWMDAKVGDWVVTPRRGKAVEINGLWYNVLRLLEGWVRQEENDGRAAPLARAAQQAQESFNQRFWCSAKGHLYDVVDGEHGDDDACRPNQLLAFSLRHPVLDPKKWEAVLQTVRTRLLTPVGLRSLAPGHPDYKAKYYGDLRARDAAYHQGTVWVWLMGPFVDAWLRVYPEDRLGARRFLEGFRNHRGEACIGSISEIFDAEEPFTPRGCIAQAWSVAEVLRCWAKTAPP
jgi:predicted glycogen debranching enzyme